MSTQQSTRIWETPNNATPPPNNNASRPAQLPSIATLTNELPPSAKDTTSPTYPGGNRSSDQWVTPPQSTRSSAYSSGPNGYYHSSSISSPHRASNSSQQFGATSHPASYHSNSDSAGTQASPGFAPPQHSLGLPTINQQYQDPSQYRSSHEFPPQESRRSSLGSQVNTGFNNLHINGVGSPYANSGNPSQSSIAASLQRERGIPQSNCMRNSGTSSIHQQQQPMSPLGRYPGESGQAYSSRTAPIISANPMKEVYNAEKPTAGQPYAFPDPDMSNRSSGSAEGNGSAMLSRRNSDHTSITSSVVTNDSRLPIGQHRLDEDMRSTHHHSLQHKQINELAESESPEATSPYSRTPALRNSHKMAERKRRTEMKYLFDALRAQIPASHGSKSSKWEILSKASEHIKNLEGGVKVGRDAQAQLQGVSHELEAIRRENESLRNENHHLFQEIQHQREHTRPSTATALHPQPPMYAAPAPPTMGDPSRSLPPLTNGIPAVNSMQGVQYSDDRR
ncbi:hypothetical protein MMC28_002110 [Mycoblastus sanguinarius]|nr:hypothetical protein [Mycoblastus sanguinarius]